MGHTPQLFHSVSLSLGAGSPAPQQSPPQSAHFLCLDEGFILVLSSRLVLLQTGIERPRVSVCDRLP